MAKRHTIVLVQTGHSIATRTYLDFESIAQSVEGVCGLYEKKLKDLNPELNSISYDIGDLYEFIDAQAEMSALVYDPTVHAYMPYDRHWLKQRAFQHLRKLATPMMRQD